MFIKILPCCISFDSYIKPQPISELFKYTYVVYLLIPTSNHNYCPLDFSKTWLYIFWFLHQTTTRIDSLRADAQLYIFWFLHQTTTNKLLPFFVQCCISFDSYIKPQRIVWRIRLIAVVYLLIPTSNHNLSVMGIFPLLVVYLLIPTSNHNIDTAAMLKEYVVYLLIPTSNHNHNVMPQEVEKVVYLLIPTSNHNYNVMPQEVEKVVYLLIPTSNHNPGEIYDDGHVLYIFWFLHQTTTWYFPEWKVHIKSVWEKNVESLLVISYFPHFG